MEVIGYRKGGIGILYLFTFIVGVAFFSYSFALESVWLSVLVGLFLITVSLYHLVGFFGTPREAIRLFPSGELVVGRKTSCRLDEITGVAYHRAHAKAIAYRWGSVTVKTLYGSCRVRYVADCERAALLLQDRVACAKADAVSKKSYS